MARIFALGTLSALLCLAAPLGATTFTVNSTSDATDFSPGNGTCETAPSSGICTLRAAVQEANARTAGAPHTIMIPAGTYLLTIPGQSEDAAVTGDLDLTRDETTLVGAGADSTIIDGNGLDRVFDANTCCFRDYHFSGLTIQNGNVAGDGGGVRNYDSRMTFTEVTIRNNSATNGGGVDSFTSALTMTGVTISGNTATAKGGGIHSHGALPALTLTNVTISGNSGSDGGGIYHASGTSTLVNVTVTNTIVASPRSGTNCNGPIVDNGNNLTDDASCGTIPATLTGLDPTLDDNGGTTLTHALLSGSSALDTGSNVACPATDQRGMVRPYNAVCDVGAYELAFADIEIDGDFSDWDGSIGTEYCLDDQGGADDWNSPSELDITRFCISSDAEDDMFVLFGFDEVALNGNSEATACVLLDTPPNDGNADFFFCVTLESNPTSVKQVGGYSCDDDAPYECNNPTPIPGFSANFGFSNSAPGPFDAADSVLELEIDWDDLGLTPGDVVFTAMISYPGQSAMNGDLNSPKDSILGGIDPFGNPYQDYDGKISYNITTFETTTTPVTLSSFEAIGGRGSVIFEWTTAAEASNVGFNLLVLEGDELRRLNKELIPSLGGDSVLPQHYSYEAYGVSGDLFMLEDIDIRGKVRHHGPFELGSRHGSERPAPKALDWDRIQAERPSTSETRGASSRARAESRNAAIGQSATESRGPSSSGAWSSSPTSITAQTSAAQARRGGRTGSQRWRRQRPRAELLVDRDGIVRVTYEDLLAAGVDFGGTPPGRMALFESGEKVPVRIVARGFFGPGAFIEFVGKAHDSLYTKTNVYTLAIVGSRPAKVTYDHRWAHGRVMRRHVETRKVETNRAYHFASPTGDPWYDQRLLAYRGPAEVEIPIELDGWGPYPETVRMAVAVWGVTDFPKSPDHHLKIEVNGVELADEWFDGLTERVIEFEIPGYLIEQRGPNTLRLVLPRDTGAPYDLVHFDHYVVTYPRHLLARDGKLTFSGRAAAFKVRGLETRSVVGYRVTEDETTFLSKIAVRPGRTGWEAVLPGSRQPATYVVADRTGLIRPGIRVASTPGSLTDEPAEYLIVSHSDFLDGLDPLVRARQRQGLSVRVVDVRDVYRAYNHGVVDPRAIRDYVARARSESDTRYVLLVGGDTYDYHDHLGLGSMSFVPSLYAPTGSIVHFAPADPLIGDVDFDGVPDLPVGRLPVRTAAELEALIDKILDYERGAAPRQAIFAADAFDLGTGYSFSTRSRELKEALGAGWRSSEIFLDDLEVTTARERLLDGMSSGASLVSYFGHSGASTWSFDRLFESADVEELSNYGRPTIVSQWGCWNTYYVAPGYDTLSHALLLTPERGAAAVVGASTLTEAESEYQLAQRFFTRLGSGATIGDALIGAKQDLAESQPHMFDVQIGFTLLGDPALVVDRAGR